MSWEVVLAVVLAVAGAVFLIRAARFTARGRSKAAGKMAVLAGSAALCGWLALDRRAAVGQRVVIVLTDPIAQGRSRVWSSPSPSSF